MRASRTPLTRVPQLKAGVRDLSHFIGKVYDDSPHVCLRPSGCAVQFLYKTPRHREARTMRFAHSAFMLPAPCLCGEILPCELTVRTGGQPFTQSPCIPLAIPPRPPVGQGPPACAHRAAELVAAPRLGFRKTSLARPVCGTVR